MNDTKENSAMAQDISITFKASEEMESAIGKIMNMADKSRSEVLRACVTLALPLLQANPSLTWRVNFSELKLNK